MEELILTDPMVEPDKKVLKRLLGKHFEIFNELEKKINEKNLIFQWNYYNDGKSWLCKILHKKKNLGWLSIWNTGFKLTFYFNEKTITEVYKLENKDDILKAAEKTKNVGKFIPLVFLVKNKKISNFGLQLIDCKMNIK